MTFDRDPDDTALPETSGAKAGLSERRRRVIVVAGMHRSGTSALSGVCSLLGADVPGELYEPAFDNPKGFFENKRIVALDDEILALLGSQYDEPVSISSDRFAAIESNGVFARVAQVLDEELGDAPLTLVKDPRICRLLPAYTHALTALDREPLILQCLRHPLEVAQSLRKRNEFPDAHGLLLWLDHVLSAEVHSRSFARCFVLYDDLMDDWRLTMAAVSGQFGLAWPRDPNRMQAEIDQFLSSDLRHHRHENRFSRSPGDLERVVERVWNALARLIADPADAAAMNELDGARNEIGQAENLFGTYAISSQRLLDRRRERITALEEHSAHMNHLLEREGAELRDAKRRIVEHRAVEERLHGANVEIGRLNHVLNETVSSHKRERAERDRAFDEAATAAASRLAAQTEHGLLLAQEVHALRRQHEMMLASVSWRALAPLRAASRQLPAPLKHGARRALRLARSWFAPLPPPQPAPKAIEVRPDGEAGAAEDAPGAPTDNPADLPPVPTREQEVVDAIRRLGRFDAAGYEAAHGVSAEDALWHYVREGEALGLAPGPDFDPIYYARKYPDVAQSGANLFCHYLTNGEAEGRRGTPMGRSLPFPPLEGREGARTVLVIAHEASRTGAPILAWNIARHLRRSDTVVTLLMRGGEFTPSFGQVSDVVLGPVVEGYVHIDPFEAEFVVDDIVARYRIDYVVANSVETRDFATAFARRGVPVVALVHEFSTYYRPPGILHDLYDLASRIVFPAQVVRAMSQGEYEVLRARRSEIVPQGQSEVPLLGDDAAAGDERSEASAPAIDFLERVEDDAFLVVGMGTVQQRKGVDLFVAAAAAARAAAPEAKLRFVWIGHGYEPDRDLQYSVYLHAQIMMSGLEDVLEIVEPVRDLTRVYERMGALLLTSRLDPLPNVSIDAAVSGTPVVCFAGASGMADILLADEATAPLVAPHMDATRAGETVARLATDPAFRQTTARAIGAIGASRFDMASYIERLRVLGEEAIAEEAALRADAERLEAEAQAFDHPFYVGADLGPMTGAEAIAHYLRRSRHRGNRPSPYAYSRRPLPGFNPDRFAQENPAPGGRDPLLRFLEAGRPAGPWAHPVLRPQDEVAAAAPALARTLLHGHFHYPDLLPEFLERLRLNAARCDLVLTTSSEEKAARLRGDAAAFDRGTVRVEVVPNRGRDIGPFLTALGPELGAYDLVGHLHGKKSARLDAIDATYGERWREFLWEHLLGGRAPMLDRIRAAFAADPKLGLVFADDPNVVGWDGSLPHAQALARRMGRSEALPESFDFPNGTMFWARPAALRPLLDLGLGFEDYPAEPLADDGTLLHAIERLLPFAAERAGLRSAVTQVPGVLR